MKELFYIIKRSTNKHIKYRLGEFKMKKRKIALGLALILGTSMFSGVKAYSAVFSGWEKTSDHWSYYRNGSLCTGWVNESGKWYYLNSDGSLASNMSVNGYYIDRDGIWDKTGDNRVVISTDKAEYNGDDNNISVKIINNTDQKIQYTDDFSIFDNNLNELKQEKDFISGDMEEEFELGPYSSNAIIINISHLNKGLSSGSYKIGIKINGEYAYGDFKITGQNNTICELEQNTKIQTSKNKYSLNEVKEIPFVISNNSNEEMSFTEGYWIEKYVDSDYKPVRMKNTAISKANYKLMPGESWKGLIKVSDISEKLQEGKYRIGKNIDGNTVYGYFRLSK